MMSADLLEYPLCWLRNDNYALVTDAEPGSRSGALRPSRRCGVTLRICGNRSKLLEEEVKTLRKGMVRPVLCSAVRRSHRGGALEDRVTFSHV